MTEEISKAASLYRIGRYRDLGIEAEYVWSDIDAAFEAGAAWQKENADPSPDTVRAAGLVNKAAIDRHNEIRDALGTLGEGMAEILKRQIDVSRIAESPEKFQAIMSAVNRIGEMIETLATRPLSQGLLAEFQSVRDVGFEIDRKVVDVGQKVEACMTIASNTEEGLAVSIEKLDKLGVEKWREAIKHVEAEESIAEYAAREEARIEAEDAITEPMHAEVKATGVYRGQRTSWGNGKPADTSGLGKLWADVPVKLEEVSDETLHELAVSGQISEARYFEEFTRRHGIKRDRPTARDVIAMMEKAMLAADEAGVKLDWRVTVGAI